MLLEPVVHRPSNCDYWGEMYYRLPADMDTTTTTAKENILCTCATSILDCEACFYILVDVPILPALNKFGDVLPFCLTLLRIPGSHRNHLNVQIPVLSPDPWFLALLTPTTSTAPLLLLS